VRAIDLSNEEDKLVAHLERLVETHLPHVAAQQFAKAAFDADALGENKGQVDRRWMLLQLMLADLQQRLETLEAAQAAEKGGDGEEPKAGD
jgi:hypothetical protein